MKLSTAINKATVINAVIWTNGYSIPIRVSKTKAQEAMNIWMDSTDFEADGIFNDAENFPVAHYDYDRNELNLGQ